MSGSSKLTSQITMISHSIFTEFFATDVINSGVIISHFVVHSHYHTFWEPKLFINFLDILFKCVYKYLCNIVIIIFFYKSNWFFRLECIIITLYVVTIFAGDVFPILLGAALVRACWQLRCEGFKICIYYKCNPHWSIAILKRYFCSVLGKFDFESFVWLTVLTMRC